MKATLHTGQHEGHPLAWRHWSRPGGRPVLALHCSLSHGGEWAGLAAHLPGTDLTAPDLTGHGRMPEWDGRADLHGDSTAIARSLALRIGGGGPVDVIGHSFGGTVALRLALESPGLIRRLVLIEPVLFAAGRDSSAWPGFLAQHRAVEALFAGGDRAAALREFLAVWGGEADAATLTPKLEAYMQARIGLVMAIDAVLIADALGLLAPGQLERLACPVLLIEGADSPPIIGAVHTGLARRLAGAQRLAVPGARHMLPVTHAVEVAALVGAFLD